LKCGNCFAFDVLATNFRPTTNEAKPPTAVLARPEFQCVKGGLNFISKMVECGGPLYDFSGSTKSIFHTKKHEMCNGQLIKQTATFLFTVANYYFPLSDNPFLHFTSFFGCAWFVFTSCEEFVSPVSSFCLCLTACNISRVFSPSRLTSFQTPPVSMNSLGSHISPSQKKCTVLKKYLYHEEDVVFPADMLYKDSLCLFPHEKLTLDKWSLPKNAFEILRKDFSFELMSLSLDKTLGVTASRLEVFPSLKNLNILHLKGVLTIDVPTASLIGRLSRVYELDISENKVEEKAFHHIFSRLQMLKYLYCNKCKGIDDFALQTIANNVAKFRKLSHIYMAENHDYSDEGMLALVTVGPNVIIELDISGSNSLTTLSMAGVRKQMSSLRMLNLSNVRGSGQSAFEFIAEGCVFLTELDIHKSSTLNDAALILIGRKCNILRKLNIADCSNVTDIGIKGFVHEFRGHLRSLNISGCVQCGGPSAFALSTSAEAVTSIKLNCLSMVTMASMKALWKKLPLLEEFEMSADIRR
jgi:hypothetical protein